MLAYIILFLFIGLAFLLPNKYFNKYGVFILMAIFAIFFGTRNNLAVDDSNYILMFLRFSKNLEGINIHYPNIEIILKIICRILGILHFNYKGLFLFYAAWSFVFLGLFLNKFKLNKKELFIFVISFLAFAFTTYITVMRQFLSITIVMYALILFVEKKYKSSIILIFIATVFHTSAIITLFILPIFMDKLKIDYRIKIGLPIICLIMGEIGLINKIIAVLASSFKYAQYILPENQNVFGGSGIIHYLLLGIYIVKTILSRKKEIDTINIFMDKGQFIYFILFFATINSGFAMRISYLYLPFICFLFISFIRQIEKEEIKKKTIICTYIIISILICKNMVTLKDTKFMSNNFSIDFFNQNRIN